MNGPFKMKGWSPFTQKPSSKQQILREQVKEIKRQNALENKENLDLARTLNKMRFEMGHLYPITSKEEIEAEKVPSGRPRYSPREVQTQLDRTAQTEKERLELYNRDVSGRGRLSPGDPSKKSTPEHITEKTRLSQDIRFIQTAKRAGGEAFDKLMSLPSKDLVNFQNEVIKVAKPLVGVDLSDVSMTQGIRMVKDIDLSVFKPYLEKADINTGDIKKIVNAQIGVGMPDENEDGVPDAFEGKVGKLKKYAIDKLINSKLKDLE